MIYLRAFFLIVAVSLGSLVIQACSDDANAGGGTASGPTDAEFNQLTKRVDDLETALTDMQAVVDSMAVSVNRVTSGSNAGGSGKYQKTSAALSDFCAYSGYTPADGPIYNATSIQCKSTTGYLFSLAIPDGGKPLEIATYYQSADCSGTAYAHTGDISAYGRRQGTAFKYRDGNVGYIPPNPQTMTLTIQSGYWFGACHSNPGTSAGFIEVIPNDEATTAVSSSGYAGPILIE